MLQHQRGFTLLELIIVIIILGMLASSAAPRLMGLSGDAKAAVIVSFAGAMKSAANLHQMKHQIEGCARNHRNVGGVSMHFGAVYSGDWDINNLASGCGYGGSSNNGVPEIIEAMNISTDKLADYWMLHTRNEPAPNRDALYIAPFPPAAQRGVWTVAHGSPVTDASALTATNCYIKYSTPRFVIGDETIETVVSGC